MASKKETEREEEISFLFEELSIADKRSALLELGGPQGGHGTKTSEEVENGILESGRSLEEIIKVLRRVHGSTPKKHCFFGSIRGNARRAVQRLTQAAQEKKRYDDVTLTFANAGDGVTSLTFERVVIAHRWVTLAPRAGFEEVAGKRTISTRHATIVRIDLDASRALLTYRGLPIGTDYDYEASIAAVLKALTSEGLHLEPLPVRACITALITAKGRRVLPVRGDLLTPDGEIKLRSRAGKASIEQLVARLLSDGDTSETELLDKITASLGKHTFEVIGLLWADEKVFTRVAL